MFKILLIILVVLILLIVLDFVLASFRSGLSGIPISVFLLIRVLSIRDFRKTIVKVYHDMSAEELLKMTKKERPTYKRDAGNGVRVFNDTYDTFFIYRALQIEHGDLDYISHSILLPQPQYHYTNEPEIHSVYTSKLFEVERMDTRKAVKDLENVVYISKVPMQTDTPCESVIYNDLDKEVTIQYLGNKENPDMEQLFVLGAKKAVVVETNSLIRVVEVENTEEREKAENEMLCRLRENAGGIVGKLKKASTGDSAADALFVTLCAAGLAGVACHEAVKALGKPMEVVEGKYGRKYYFGDEINQYLCENKYSVAEMVQEVIKLPEEMAWDIIKKAAIGDKASIFGGIVKPDHLYKRVIEIWDGLFEKTTVASCSSPDEWPVFYAIVLQEIVKDQLRNASKEMLFRMVTDAAYALSAMDKEYV